MSKFQKVEKPRTKAQMIAAIAEATELPKSDVTEVLQALNDLILFDLGPRQVGSVSLPGLIKIDIRETKTTKDRMGRNPATGEAILIKGKRGKKRGKVGTRALKTLKDVL